jgi:hypothetical protein
VVDGVALESSHDTVAADGDKNPLLSGLPPAETKRWSCRRKAAVVIAIRAGVLNRREACARDRLSLEELASWETALDQNGIPGRASRVCRFTATPRSENAEAL